MPKYPDPDDDTDSMDSDLTSSADAPLEQIMYLLSDRLSIDRADNLHLVGQYLKISGYFKGMSFPPKLIEDYYRSLAPQARDPKILRA
ncbi:hypothetical protein L198_06164 [Cryptococcus wingfieldii CBS 7118]|uniref:Uncharacterized protein n=1 Tax=Cryptococcus wingfieldii CBS 7118 TaxID=1295528 RepID=A0A1E3IQD3_9TREE|nr:hypothetical protein L198_06164 [Cryptococcus wingfieldii CBS 7118]ODN90146.1 hypothetical protein L198_06164 [Cryptococcus wingfieldii CBS 7118]